jgi:hypothetical protein
MKGSAMIARIDVDPAEPGSYAYRVSFEGEELYADSDLSSMTDALVAAVEGLPPEVAAVEVAYQAIVSGTYPLDVLAMNPSQIADHAGNTAAAVHEALANR